MLKIIPATKKDAELIYNLAAEVFTAAYEKILSPPQSAYMLEMMYAPAATAKNIDEGQEYFLLKKDNDFIGYAAVEQEAENLFHLQKIYVLPDYQGIGAGRFLFLEIINYLKNKTQTPFTVELNVNRYNEKAIAFYKQMGFTVVRQGDFPIGNNYFMNDFIMQLSIKKKNIK